MRRIIGIKGEVIVKKWFEPTDLMIHEIHKSSNDPIDFARKLLEWFKEKNSGHQE